MSNNDILPAHHDPEEPADGGRPTDCDLKMLWVSRTLANIDFQYCEEMLILERSTIEVEQLSYIKRQLLLKYRERRAPYQTLLESLRT
jgi:hypothetical protein